MDLSGFKKRKSPEPHAAAGDKSSYKQHILSVRMTQDLWTRAWARAQEEGSVDLSSWVRKVITERLGDTENDSSV